MVVVSDFTENVVIIGKHEVSEQYFHRSEVMLFGAVVDILVSGGDMIDGHPDATMESELEKKNLRTSYMVSSDYR